MSPRRRVVYAILGLLPVLVALYALYTNYGVYTMYARGWAFVESVFSFDHEWTMVAFFMLAVGLYLVTSSIRGERLLSRKWPPSAVAAVVLAWLLICGVAGFRGFISPEPLVPYLQPRVMDSPE